MIKLIIATILSVNSQRMTSKKQMKQIFDPIHRFIELTPLMQKIIYTWEFGRLYDLHQLGAAYYIYPSAVHKRSEHSLGVSHLAGIMAETLIACSEVDKIKDEDGITKLIIDLPSKQNPFNWRRTIC